MYFVVDISLGMLKRCRKSMENIKKPVVLPQAEAEASPKAVFEMLYIAKSGLKLMIYDETEKVRSKFSDIPVAGEFYKQEEIKNQVRHLP